MSKQSAKAIAFKDTLSESEEEKFKQKCKDLKRRIIEVEQSNEIASLAIYRSKANIRRLRLEHAILLERLEQRALEFPTEDEELLLMNEDVPVPPTPTLLTDSLSAQVPKLNRNGVTKGTVKKGMKGVKLKNSENGSSGVIFTVKTPKVRDPDLPKRPTNAYLIFCELEKERVRAKLEEKGTPAPGDLGKALIEEWGTLNKDDKAPFFKLYEEDKLRYNTELEAYNKKKNIVPEEPPAKKVKRKTKAAEKTEAEPTVKVEADANTPHIEESAKESTLETAEIASDSTAKDSKVDGTVNEDIEPEEETIPEQTETETETNPDESTAVKEEKESIDDTNEDPGAIDTVMTSADAEK